MISYFVAAAILLLSLSVVRIANPARVAGKLEVFCYRLAWAWFFLATLIHINALAALLYGLLLPWIAGKAIAAFPPEWFAERQRRLAWLMVVVGSLAMLATLRYFDW